MNLLLSNDTQ